jgi:hypothetical protein
VAVTSRAEQKFIRMGKWLDRIILNIERIQDVLKYSDPQMVDYDMLRTQIMEQYRLLRLLKDVQFNKTRIDGVDVIKTRYIN